MPAFGSRTTRRTTLLATLATLVALLVMAALQQWGATPRVAFSLAACCGLLLSWAAVTRARRSADRRLLALADGVRSFEENDFSLRLSADPRDDAYELADLFNRLGNALRAGRQRVYQRELLLDTLLQSAPMGVMLVDNEQRITYANRAAWALFGGGARLEQRSLAELAGGAPPRLRAALLSGEDGVIRLPGSGDDVVEETVKLARRRVELNGRPLTLIVIERITADVLRQEILVWKKVIRLMTHELNNSLAPVSSLLHSARTIAAQPERGEKLEELLGRVGQRVGSLAEFLEGYARFARLPPPVFQEVPWSAFVAGVRSLMPCELEEPLPSTPGWFDAAQMEQVLINLLKNAGEAGSAPHETRLRVEVEPGGVTVVTVLDRGRGMDEETRRLAMQPFYTRRPGGSGLGLALCREILEAHGGHLTLEPRAGGGTAAVCVLPVRP